MSQLDPAVYGPPESAITKEILEQELHGMSVDEVLRFSACFQLFKLHLFVVV